MYLLFDPFQSIGDLSTGTTMTKALVAVLISFALGMLIAFVYKKTYQGRRYSQTFVQTIVIMGVVVSLIMMVIGNNIAVAFGLVGAFSIIRFRTAMNDPKDIAFIFFGMAVGIACGLGFYLLAIAFTVTVCVFIYLLTKFNFGFQPSRQTLRIVIPENMEYEGLFDDVFAEYVTHHELVEVETVNMGTAFQLEFAVRLKEGAEAKQLIDSIRERNANLKVSMMMLPSAGL